MSIVSALQEYLKGFDGMTLKTFEYIQTDRTENAPASYAVARAGGGETHRDITGKRYYKQSFVFRMCESAAAEADRKENWDFLDTLTEWIEEQSENGVYPVLPGRYEAEGIEVANAMLFDFDENGNAIYQVQIQLEICKR